MHRLTFLLAALLLFAPASYTQVVPGQTFTGTVLPVTDGEGVACDSLFARR